MTPPSPSIAKGLSPINFSASHNFPREYDPAPYAGCQRALFVTTLGGPPEIWRYWPDCPACFSMVRSAKDRGGSVCDVDQVQIMSGGNGQRLAGSQLRAARHAAWTIDAGQPQHDAAIAEPMSGQNLLRSQKRPAGLPHGIAGRVFIDPAAAFLRIDAGRTDEDHALSRHPASHCAPLSSRNGCVRGDGK